MTEYTQYIVSHIRGQITGDYEKDMQYLYDCSEKYKEDEESADILREIASMMYEILPDDQKEQVEQHKCAAAALTGNIRELPHVADADGAARAHQQEAQTGAEGFAFHAF